LDEDKTKRGSGCLKAAAMGCLAALALVVIGGFAVWLNWDAIKNTELYRSISASVKEAQAEMQPMLDLRAELLEHYPSQQVNVRINSNLGGGERRRSLVVAFVNPKFSVPETDGGRRNLAREIAVRITASYPDVTRFQAVVIAFVAQRSVGLTFSKTTSYSFETRELVSGEPAGGSP